MDSGSESMQSSSGGEEEYDSQAEPIPPPFLNNNIINPSTHFSSSFRPVGANPQPHFFTTHYGQNHQPATTFDPSSNYLQSLSNINPQAINSNLNYNSNTPMNLDMLRSATLRSDPGSSSSSSPHVIGSTQQIPLAVNDIDHTRAKNSEKPKSSKKRTRASRRAPTTVLTTDTTNFRAMVQEFTGIPAPPFSAGSPYSTTHGGRLDLFGSGSSMAAALYPLRPSVQKVNQQFLSTANTTSTPSLLNNQNNNSNNNNFNSNSNSYDQNINTSRHHDHHHQNMGLNIQDPILSFQPNSSLSLPHSFGSSSVNANLGGGAFSINGESSRDDDHSWRDIRAGSNGGRLQDQACLGNFEGNVSTGSDSMSRISNSCKLNFTGSMAASESFDRHGKGLENVNVSARGEGSNIDSWNSMCPSD